jgi:transposase-like protein
MLGHRKAQEGANIAECLTFSSNGAARAVYCPHCATPNVKKNGVKANGQQNFYRAAGRCKDCRRQFQFEYRYPGADPRVKRKVCEMAMNGTGLAHQRYP